MSSKDKAKWYSQKLKKKQNSYDTTGQLKKLAILKKAEIKETNTHETQIEENYSDSTWTALNLNADSEDVDNWEVDIRLKMRYKHPENQHWEMCQQLLKRQQKELKKKVNDLKKQQEETKKAKACLKLNKLMKDVWATTNSVLKQLVWKTKSHKIKIHLLTEYLKMMIVESFQKTTCHLSFWRKWKHFRTRFSENIISMNHTYTQNSILRKTVKNTYNWSYKR